METETRRPVIAIVIKGLGIGGAERLIAEAATVWDRSRFDYRVAYLLSWKDQLVGELEEQGVEVSLVGVGKGVGPRTMGRIRRFLRQSGADLVHVHLPAAGILVRLASPVPVVYTEHNVVDFYRRPTRLMNRLTYGRNERTIAVSDAVAHSVAGYPGAPPVVIDNGVGVSVSPEVVASARAELAFPEGVRLIVHVGNLRPHKGHRTLLAAVVALARTRDDFHLISIGGDKYPGDLDRLQGEIDGIGVSDRMTLLGRRASALPFLAAADVVVNPSDIEGLPLAVLEAMALGRPVVATAVGGVPDLIESGRTGLLVPPGDASALAEALAAILDDREAAEAMGARAAARVAQTHGLEQMVRSIEQIYDELLGLRP